MGYEHETDTICAALVSLTACSVRVRTLAVRRLVERAGSRMQRAALRRDFAGVRAEARLLLRLHRLLTADRVGSSTDWSAAALEWAA
jgi:hypothetical protein